MHHTMSRDEMLDLSQQLCKHTSDLQRVFKESIQIIMLKRTPPSMEEVKSRMRYDDRPIIDSYEKLNISLATGFIMCAKILSQLETFIAFLEEDDCNVDCSKLKTFWDASVEALEKTKEVCRNCVKEVYELEVERTGVYVGLAHNYGYEKPRETNEQDEIYDRMVHTFYRRLWLPWSGSALIVAQYEPGSLPLDYMLTKTDAIHLVFFHIFTRIVYDNRSSASAVTCARKIIRRGFPGPASLIREGIAHYQFSINNGHSRAYIEGQTMLVNTINHSFFTASVYRRVISSCVRSMVPIVVELYIDMRRVLIQSLNWFFGETLREKVAEALSHNLGPMFQKCIEFNRRSNILIKEAQKVESLDDLIIIMCDTLSPLFLEFQDLDSTFYYIINDYLQKTIIQHYSTLVSEIFIGMSEFASRACTILSMKGITFSLLSQTTRTDMINLLLCVNEFSRTCSKANNEMLRPLTLVKLVEFSKMPMQFKEAQNCLLCKLRGLPSLANTVSPRDIYLNLPLTPQIRHHSGKRFGVAAYEGWNPEFGESAVPSQVISEKLHLGSEKPNPEVDAIMNDDTFRQLFTSAQLLSISCPKEHGKLDWSQLICEATDRLENRYPCDWSGHSAQDFSPSEVQKQLNWSIRPGEECFPTEAQKKWSQMRRRLEELRRL